MDEIFALVDCNSFYCSCERVFNPKLNNRPVIVLSNNDGCAVARTDEAKAIGIQMGAPFFQIKDLCKKHDVAVYSSNYTLYGDMSRRVMQTLNDFTPEMEIYSIDEAFLSLRGFNSKDLANYGLEIKKTVKQYTGIPVSIGIAKTKVLAKVANKLAKRKRAEAQSAGSWTSAASVTGVSPSTLPGVCHLETDKQIENALREFPVEDLWGIGRQSTKKLAAYNIKTALQLRNANEKFVQKLLTIQGRRIVRELKGESCINLQLIEAEKKQIISSRSFGRPVRTLEELRESVANHVTTAAEKLRQQNSLTKSILVFVQTNPFKNVPQYYNSGTVQLMSGSSTTNKLIKQAFYILDHIYKEGFEYKKCGVIFTDLYPKVLSQIDMFGFSDTKFDDERMKVIDEVNKFHGRGTVKHAACGIEQFWQMLSGMKSRCFTTRWSELLEVD